MSSIPSPASAQAETVAPQPLVLLVMVGKKDIKVWTRQQEKTGEYKFKDEPLDLRREPNNTAGTFSTRREFDQKLLLQLQPQNPPALWTFASREELSATHTVQPASEVPTHQLPELLPALQRLKNGEFLCQEGRLLLSAAKLGELVQGLKDCSTTFKVIAAAIIYTDREKGEEEGDELRDYENEPIASGSLIQHFLHTQLGLAKEDLLLINALQGATRLEGSPMHPEDFPIQRKAVSTIDEGLRNLSIQLEQKGINRAWPILSSTGGMDPIKHVLYAAAALRFNTVPRDLSIPEFSKQKKPYDWGLLVHSRLANDNLIVPRNEALAARARALLLAQQGEFAGAWAAVSYLKASKNDHWWLLPLQAVARYFGSSTDTDVPYLPFTTAADSINSSSKEIFDALQQLSLQAAPSSVERYQRFALNSAFRLEASLQGSHDDRRLAEALMALCTLIDNLVVTKGTQLVAAKQVGVAFFTAEQAGRNIQFNTRDQKCPKDLAPYFNLNNSGTQGQVTSAIQPWFKFSKTIADHPFRYIEKLETALTRPTAKSGGKNLRSLRNDQSHRALGPEDLANIARLGEAQGIWTSPDTASRPGTCALTSTLITEALKSCGIKDAGQLYQSLIVDGLIKLLSAIEPSVSSTTRVSPEP